MTEVAKGTLENSYVVLDHQPVLGEGDTPKYRMKLQNDMSDTIFMKVFGTEMPTIEERAEALAALYARMDQYLIDGIR